MVDLDNMQLGASRRPVCKGEELCLYARAVDLDVGKSSCVSLDGLGYLALGRVELQASLHLECIGSIVARDAYEDEPLLV